MPYAELGRQTSKPTKTGAEEAAELQNAAYGGGEVSINPFAGLRTGGGFMAPQQPSAPAARAVQTAPSATGSGGGAALQGLQAALPAAAPEPAADETGGMAAMMASMGGQAADPMNLFLPGVPGSLRQGMGNRIYPMDVPMQGLSRAY